jgi:glycerol kinase
VKPKYVGALDQGTTSTRFMLCDQSGAPVTSFQLEHQQIYPQPGWVEHDPLEIWERACQVIEETMRQVDPLPGEIAAIGIANQRETTVVWDPVTGEPWCNAIVWQDTRTSAIVSQLSENHGKDGFREKTGLPVATYFSGTKIRWILDNVKGVRSAAEKGRAVFGTVDSWLVWNLTGGARRGVFVTDVTNASRTMLFDIKRLSWDAEMLDLLEIPDRMLPEVHPSISKAPFGYTTEDGPFGHTVPVCGILGDQQAALFGQACFDAGTSKNTYGTGCFLLMNTGAEVVDSKCGLITTVAFKKDDEDARYALEGSVAVAGALVQWLRDNLGFIERSADIENLASQETDNGGVYFVPAFSGLYAPHWRPDARGIIAGLTGYVNSSHIARAVLESTAFQSREIVEAMEKDSGFGIQALKVDGGMAANDLLMQFQADILDIPVVRPDVAEITAKGAAYAAGLASGFWQSLDELALHWSEGKRWIPHLDENERARQLRFWKKAVERSLDWIE